MFALLTKIAYLFLKPSNLLVALAALGFLASLISRRIVVRLLAGLAIAGLVVIGFPPTTGWIAEILEDRFPAPGRLDPPPVGIIVLGGAQETHLTALRGAPQVNASAERTLVVPDLARLYPQARIVLTGGNAGEAHGVSLSEAEIMRELIVSAGVAPERITTEGRSWTTWENATFTKAMVHPEPGSRWLLVTSGWHMPRAMGAFRAAGWDGVVAYPVDFVTGGPDALNAGYAGAGQSLALFDILAKEIIGLGVYRMAGRSDAWFPAP